MRLYLLRHADAVPRGTPGYRQDAQRPLTEAGHVQAREVAEGLKRLKVPVDAIGVSVLLRAAQTAEYVARAFGLEQALRQLDTLRPEAEPADTSQALRAFSRCEHVVLVGHEPHLSTWLGWLVAEQGQVRCLFKKAGVACVEIERAPPAKGSGTLRWFMTPKQLALIGKTV